MAADAGRYQHHGGHLVAGQGCRELEDRHSTAATADRRRICVRTVQPMTPQPLGEVSVMDAYRQGRLADRGAPAPPPRAPRDRRGMPW
ncbi:MAG: hypothetical protein QOD58_2061 [Mycobacterium sp.]|nr:hypothetical protein [Mycobacterium sp.]